MKKGKKEPGSKPGLQIGFDSFYYKKVVLTKQKTDKNKNQHLDPTFSGLLERHNKTIRRG